MVNHPNRKKRAQARVRKPVIAPTAHTRPEHEHDYSGLLDAVRLQFDLASTAGPLFITDAADLYETYLDNLPSERQTHTCTACRKFIETFGGIIAIKDNGIALPAMWSPTFAPDFYKPAFDALHVRVINAKIGQPFLSPLPVWGTPKTGVWTHLSVEHARPYTGRAFTAGQAMAAQRENFHAIGRALADFQPALLDEALRVLQANVLGNSAKFIAPLRWLRDLHDRPKGRIGQNLLWRAIVLAPEGYCHPRAAVTASLLEDIAAGLPFEQLRARFDAKVHPLQYQRPQSAPSTGNIAAAEALVAKLGIAPSLERRYARVDELQPIWLPQISVSKPAGAGVFGHIQAKDETPIKAVDLPPAAMSWSKFMRTVLPTAAQIDIRVPHGRSNFMAMTTAVNADAPPILKWDFPEERNPVAIYTYVNGSYATNWSLKGGTWAAITCIAKYPMLWGQRPMPFIANGTILTIEGCADIRTDQGNALFPVCLKDDLHSIRSTIEAYAKAAKLAQVPNPACGIGLTADGHVECTLRVHDAADVRTYNLDRWE